MTEEDRPDDLDVRAAEIERQRRELEAAQQRLEQERREHDLERQQQELERQRQEIEAQRAELERRRLDERPQSTPAAPGFEPVPGPPPWAPATERVPTYAAPPAYTAQPAAPAPQGRRTGAIVAAGLVALLTGAAGGWFGYDIINDDDSADTSTQTSTEAVVTESAGDTTAETDATADAGADASASDPSAEPTPAEPAATPIPIEVTTWKSGDGDLQASFPADYTVAWDTQEFDGVSAVLLFGASDFPATTADDFNRFTGETANVGRYSRAGLTPEILLGEVFEPDAECTGEDPPESLEVAGSTGLLVRSTDCGGVGGERLRMAFQAAPDVVTYVSVRSATAGGGTTIANAMAASLSTEPDADTPTAAPFGCAQVGPASDPEFPLVTVVVNRTDDDISFYELDPSTGGPYSGNAPLDLPPGFSNFLTFRAEGGFVLRIDRPQGPLDYTVTEALAQCILVTDEGLLAG